MPYKDHEHTKAAKRRYRKEKTEAIRALKEVPCTDCGMTYPHYVMDFDHVPERGTKEFIVAASGFSLNSEKFKAELAKCDVVCKNCHGIRTWFRSIQ